MATRGRAATRVVPEGTASSTVSPRSSAHDEAICVDEATAGSPTTAGCQPGPETPSESGSGRKGADYFTGSVAKRVRYDQAGAVEFEMVDRICFKGGFLLTATVLNTTLIEGTKMMKVGAREEWLCQAATGKMERRGVFPRGVLRTKSQLTAAISDAAFASQEQKVMAAASGRALLDLGDSSESSSSSGESEKAKKPKVDNPMSGSLQTVKFRGAKFKAMFKGKRVYVEATADVAQRIVHACLDATVELVTEETRLDLEGPPPATQEVWVVKEDGPDGLKVPDGVGSRVANPTCKFIRFDSRRSCYEIMYVAEDDDGECKLHRSVKGLRVRSKGKGGTMLSEEKCDQIMARVYEKAEKLWNESDQTDRLRYLL